MSETRKDDLPADQRLRITEIFHSLQGEALASGIPTVFIRLTGCPLRCRYCDTAYAFYGGNWKSLEDILTEVAGFSASHVCVTGGEPLAQKNCIALLHQLCDAGYKVSLETSGAMDISAVDSRVSRVLDVKTPASGENKRNKIENFQLLNANDQLKFVLCDRADYEWAGKFIEQHDLADRCEILLSPSFGELEGRKLADWILEDKLKVRFQIQLHKILWGDQPGH